MLTDFLRTAFWVWLVEIGVAGINYFLLMERLYKPRIGALRAHRLGMATRIACVLGAAFLLAGVGRHYSTPDLAVAGLFWLGLTLTFEWGGSFLLRRPVSEILVGWQVSRGYLWPYVLVAYLVSPLLAGSLLHI